MENAAPFGRGGRGESTGMEQTHPLYAEAAPSATLTARLDSVRETGPGSWTARCPAHDDRKPSLSIKETGDGTLLLKCWSGCSAAEIVAAVGLELRDLFPPTDRHHSPPKTSFERRRYGQALDALKALTRESLIVLVAAENLMAGQSLSNEDLERLRLAEYRIRAVREVAA